MYPSLTRTVYLLLLAVFLFPTQTEVHASHFMGIDVRMECMNTCTSRVTWRAYRDCTGSNILTNAIFFNPTGLNCQLANASPIALGNWSTQITTEVTPVCATLQTQCTNPNSLINGVEEFYAYRDYDICSNNTLGCEFEMTWGTCCRNGIVTSGSANQGVGITSLIVTAQGCNSSPVYLNTPLFYACDGTSSNIQMGGYDPDGDSLVYALAPCYTDNGTSITYGAGYSQSSPLGAGWNVTVDPVSGLLTIAPNPGGNVVGVMCISTNEYRNGTLIGTNIRDIQVSTLTCNPNTAPTLSGISNISTGAILSAPNTVTVCAGIPVSFDVTAIDPDTTTGQTVTMLWDQSISGATFTESGNPMVTDTVIGNSPDGTFSWGNPVGGTYQITIGLRDDNCPVFTYADDVINLIVIPPNFSVPVVATPPTIDTCLGTSTTLSVPGGPYANYLWSTAATTPTITVSQTGTYMVTVTFQQGSCSGTGTGAIAVTGTATPTVSGTVTLSNGITPLVNAPVYLVVHDSTLNALTAIDTTITNAGGHYEFCTVMGADTFYLKAAPQLPTYPNHLPTYADTAVFFNVAQFYLSNTAPLSVDWSVQAGSNPGGPGFIGGLISQGANKRQGVGDPLPDEQVFLYSTSLGQFIGTTTTDVNGYFSFPGIPLGDYEISVDHPGVDEINVPMVTLNSQIPSQDSLDLRLHSTYLELVIPTGIRPPLADDYFQVFPNPSSNEQTLMLYLRESAQVNIGIYDALGRKVMQIANESISQGNKPFTIKQLPSGTYFVKVRIGEELMVQRITHW